MTLDFVISFDENCVVNTKFRNEKKRRRKKTRRRKRKKTRARIAKIGKIEKRSLNQIGAYFFSQIQASC